jgi:glycosyltransferase involved in cell wall biosynthesis
VGAMPEVVKHNENGLITEIGNPNKLADDIEYFIKNKDEAKRIGQNNVQYVRKNFDIEIIVNKLLRIIDE